jgi:hypothetical protein
MGQPRWGFDRMLYNYAWVACGMAKVVRCAMPKRNCAHGRPVGGAAFGCTAAKTTANRRTYSARVVQGYIACCTLHVARCMRVLRLRRLSAEGCAREELAGEINRRGRTSSCSVRRGKLR